MTAFNVVRFCVKPDREQEFIDVHRKALTEQFAGLRRIALVKIGERRYCFVGEWENFDAIVNARVAMIALLDGFRDCLEDLGAGLGVTDPVSGEAVLQIDHTPKPAPRRAGPARRKPAKKASAKPRAKAKKAVKAKTKKPAKKTAKKSSARRKRR